MRSSARRLALRAERAFLTPVPSHKGISATVMRISHASGKRRNNAVAAESRSGTKPSEGLFGDLHQGIRASLDLAAQRGRDGKLTLSVELRGRQLRLVPLTVSGAL